MHSVVPKILGTRVIFMILILKPLSLRIPKISFCLVSVGKVPSSRHPLITSPLKSDTAVNHTPISTDTVSELGRGLSSF